MTKKDYIKIAKILKGHKPEESVHIDSEIALNLPTPYEIFTFLVSDLIDAFKKDNDKFDEEKFRRAIYKD